MLRVDLCYMNKTTMFPHKGTAAKMVYVHVHVAHPPKHIVENEMIIFD